MGKVWKGTRLEKFSVLKCRGSGENCVRRAIARAFLLWPTEQTQFNDYISND